MFKYLLVLLALSVPSTANADRYFLLFSATWCAPCKVVKQTVTRPEMANLITQYDDNLLVDIDLSPKWKEFYQVKNIPTIMIVDLKTVDGKLVGNPKPVFKWVYGEGDAALKSGLQKHLPKPVAKPRRPLLKLLKNPADFLKISLDK